MDWLLVPPKDATPPNFMETTIANNKTLKFAKVFSLKSFPLYARYPSLIPTSSTRFQNANKEGGIIHVVSFIPKPLPPSTVIQFPNMDGVSLGDLDMSCRQKVDMWGRSSL